jgi:hypothetical protein
MTWEQAEVISTAITAFGALVTAMLAWLESRANARKLIDIHLSINSRLDQLVKAARAEGRQEERDSHSVTVPGVPLLGAPPK